MPYNGMGIGPKGPIWGMVKAIGLGVTLIIRTREDTASPGRPDYTARRMAEFNLWLLILGIAAGAAVTWLVIGTIARKDDEIASSEAAAEADWIARTIEEHGGRAPLLLVEQILSLHRRYLQGGSATPMPQPEDTTAAPDETAGADADAVAGPSDAASPAEVASVAPVAPSRPRTTRRRPGGTASQAAARPAKQASPSMELPEARL